MGLSSGKHRAKNVSRWAKRTDYGVIFPEEKRYGGDARNSFFRIGGVEVVVPRMMFSGGLFGRAYLRQHNTFLTSQGEKTAEQLIELLEGEA